MNILKLSVLVVALASTPVLAAPPYPTTAAAELDAFVRAACPQIDGVSIDGTIFFQPGATCQVIAAAAMQSFIPIDPAIEANRRTAFKAEPDRADLLNRLKTASPAQIDTWVDANVANLADARKVLKAIIKVIALDGR